MMELCFFELDQGFEYCCEILKYGLILIEKLMKYGKQRLDLLFLFVL